MSVPYRLKTAGLTINLRQEYTGPPLLFLRGSNVDLSIKSPVFDSALPEYFTVVAPALVPWSHEVHGFDVSYLVHDASEVVHFRSSSDALPAR